MIVPIEVATNGYLGTGLNTLSIAVDGYLMTVTIENVSPLSGGFLVKGTSRTIRRKQQERREKWKKENPHKTEKDYEEECNKKITVTISLNGTNYIETKYVQDMPDLTIDDVDIQVAEVNNKPKITITVIKK